MNNFIQSICHPKKGDISVIAEIKLCSPSEGVLGKREDVVERAKTYEKSYADVVSVVTEHTKFGGDTDMVREVKQAISLPVLQKDFITEKSQLLEAKQNGADAVLLITRFLKEKTNYFIEYCNNLNITPVVELFDESDLRYISQVTVVGVNARNLEDFSIDVSKACRLISLIPPQIIVIGFSGIHSRCEVEAYAQAGAKAVLVGTSMMKTTKTHEFIKHLKGL